MPDYEDLILQRQEALELYDEGEDPDLIAELYPDIAFDFEDIDLAALFEDN